MTNYKCDLCGKEVPADKYGKYLFLDEDNLHYSTFVIFTKCRTIWPEGWKAACENCAVLIKLERRYRFEYRFD